MKDVFQFEMARIGGNIRKAYALGILTVAYVLGELGHYLLGITSKEMAIDLDYGDHACQLDSSVQFARNQLTVPCESISNQSTYAVWECCLSNVNFNFVLISFPASIRCMQLNVNGSTYCEWNYNGLGIDYQLLAGPSFILVFTIFGVAFGFLADRCNRVRFMCICSVIFAIAIAMQGACTSYWQLAVLRMLMAAGESGYNPLGTGIISDLFPANKRALVMAIFNWGIYGGYGSAFPVGRYVTGMNVFNLVCSSNDVYYINNIIYL